MQYVHYDQNGKIQIGLNFVTPSEHNRSPQDFPYSFDPYFIVDRRKRNKSYHTIYSDRMWQWDRERASEAFDGKQMVHDAITLAEADSIIKSYYGDDCTCDAVAIGCNVSNGYPYLIFWIVKSGTSPSSE
jgi:hypothetical protein